MANENLPLSYKGHPLRRKDNLIYYIYKLSSEKGYTSKKCWEEKVSNLAKDLMAIDSMQRQYQRNQIKQVKSY